MLKKTTFLLFSILIAGTACFAAKISDKIKTDTVTIRTEHQYQSVRPGKESILAVHFELKKNWHFYASDKNAPGGMNLKISPSAPDYITFSKPTFPKSEWYFDKTIGETLEVFSNSFTVHLPFTVTADALKKQQTTKASVVISFEGAVCSDVQCMIPTFDKLNAPVDISLDATMTEPTFKLTKQVDQPPKKPSQSKQIFTGGSLTLWSALLLAFVAGLSMNIMPCVWPILPLVIMRIVDQAKLGKTKTITMGIMFCLGVLLFFACLAGANIILQLFYGTVLQWGDQFRNPGFVAAMALLLVMLALFMFGLFNITVPSSIAAKSGAGTGLSGTLGMGFLAAILSTPCGFGILAAAFAWAQAQPLFLATLTIMVIGAGMATPYLILTSFPAWLKHLPKAGKWMELVKQAVGFILLGIAIWVITVLPQTQRAGVLYFALVLSFCVWMWAGWVNYNTKLSRKLSIRIIAVALTIWAGWFFMRTAPAKTIDWQKYDNTVIENAIKQQRPVLIKFTADWCLSCRVVEKIVYSRSDIADLIKDKGVLAIKADTTTKDYHATKALKNKYNEPAVPVSILHIPEQDATIRWRGKAFADELKTYLKQLPSK